MKKQQSGIYYATLSYILWGILPIYWKLIDHVASDEILANRIFWSLIFMFFVLIFTKKLESCKETIKYLLKNRKQGIALIFASALISGNWFIYIWAVNNDKMIEASLGYYINPLVSILLGIVVLKERLTLVQMISVLFATIGVLILTISYGNFPWIAFGLAISFGIYGLIKKLIKVDSAIGLTLETLTITPIALLYMIMLAMNGNSSYLTESITTDLLLIGSGAVTALPLLFFAKGAQQIPLFLLGILQYIAPSLTLMLGVFLYHEPFTKIHFWSFLFIWSSLTIITFSRSKSFTHLFLHTKRKSRLTVR